MAHDADQTSSDVEPDRTRTGGAPREGDEGEERDGADAAGAADSADAPGEEPGPDSPDGATGDEGGSERSAAGAAKGAARWRPTPRQLHTLAGILLALFVLAHLWMQSHALEGQVGYGGAMASRWWDSVLLSVLIMVPLAFHGLYGAGLALRGRYDLRKNPSSENWQLALQRITGLLLGAFVVLHVATVAVERWSGRLADGDVYQWMTAELSTTHNGIPWTALAYSLGMGVCAFHLGTGLRRALVTWKPKASKRDRRLVAVGAAMLALLAFGLGSNVTVYLATGGAINWPYGPPQAAAAGTACAIASAAATPTASASTSASTTASATAEPTERHAADDLPSHYAVLFEPNRTFEYRVDHHSSRCTGPEPCPKAEKTLRTTCRISNVSNQQERWSSVMVCSPEVEAIGTHPILGARYIATAQGLWVSPADSASTDSTLLKPDRMFMAAQPAPRDAGSDDSTDRVWREGQSWCVSRSSAGGDESGYSACLSSTGFVRASWFWAGGETHDFKATLVR